VSYGRQYLSIEAYVRISDLTCSVGVIEARRVDQVHTPSVFVNERVNLNVFSALDWH
jgi:hypothetical protein